jgi:hypothetical protein
MDPIAILWPSDQLPRSIATRSEEVLLVIQSSFCRMGCEQLLSSGER